MTRPGLTAFGEYAVGDLPAANDISTPSLSAYLLANRADRIILLIAKPRIPGSMGQVRTIYAASDEYSTKPTDTPANQIFRARLLSSYNIQYSLWGGLGQLPIPKQTVDGKTQLPSVRSIPSFGVISFVAADGDYDNLTRLSWIGCEIDIYVTVKDAAFSPPPQIFKGTCGGITWDPARIDLSIRDLQQNFQIPLQSELYTTGAITLSAPSTPAATATITTPSGSKSIESWVKPSSDSSTRRDLIGWQGTTAGCFGIYYNTNGSNYLTAFAVNNAGTIFKFDDNLTVPSGTWIQVAITLDVTAGFLYLYINRTLRGSVAVTGTFTTAATAFTLANATISELRLWSVARTLGDVALNMYLSYPCATGGAYTGLYAYYTFPESVGTTSVDQTGVRGAITLNGASWDTGDWQQSQCLGKVKPVAIGELKYPAEIPLQLVDPNAPSTIIFQAHHRPMQAFLAVRHAGLALVAGVDYTVDLYRGYVFAHVNVTATMTADVQGDTGVGSPDGLGYVNRKADIAVRIAALYGGTPYPTGVDLSSVSDLNIKDPSPHGIFINSSQTIGDAIDSLMDGCSWTFNRQGQLTLGRLDLPGVSTEDINQNKIVYGSLSRQPTPEPSKRQRVGYNHVWQTQPPAQLSTSLTTADRELLSRPDSFVAPGTDLSIVKDYPLASDVQILTLRYDQSAAEAESIRRQLVYGQSADIYKVRVVEGLFKHWLLDTITLTYKEEVPGSAAGATVVRYDISGRKFVIIGLVETVASDPSQPDVVEYTLWGPRVSGLIIDTATLDKLVVDTVTGDRLKIGN